MKTYDVLLFVHLLFLLLGVGAATIVSVCLFRLRAARTLEAAGPWGMLAGQTERAFPFAILGLFGSGAYMTSHSWTWSTGWIDVAIAVLVLLAVQGAGIAGRRAEALKHALQQNGPGPLGAEALRLTRDRMLWGANFCNIGMVLGVVWNMTQKPGTASAVAAVAGGYAVGAMIAWRFTRAPAFEAAAATEPAT
jgi:hypothetical protein